MSVIVKGIEMPEDCFSCRLKEEGFCNLTDAVANDIYKRNDDCPLVELPEKHGRLIDADALIHELNNSHYPGAPYIDAGISIAIGKVCDAPTIEPERKIGEWKHISDGYVDIYECDQCGKKEDYERNYCPDCGAYMKKENKIIKKY